MDNLDIIDVITVVGTLATLIGLSFTLYYVLKTKGAVKAAQEAIAVTEKKIQSNILIADFSTLVQYIESIKLNVRSDDLKSALLRLSDLKSQLARLTHISKHDNLSPSRIKVEMGSLSEIEVKLEKALELSDSYAIDKPAVYAVLNKLSVRLNESIGPEIYKPENKT